MATLGDNLIFLISQPRAGSTLLQRILGSHPDIHTVSEPWLMLHPLSALRLGGCQADYNASWARVAVHEFLESLHNGEDEYFQGVRRMCTYLYERALADSGKRHFLDKTPRYYFIIPELYRVFPQARYIILLRNPLAVLCSIVDTWVRDDLFSLHKFKHDLLLAPRLILEGLHVVGSQGTIIHYEQLVKYPEDEVKRICKDMGIEFVPETIEYGRRDLPHWPFGDQEQVYQHRGPISQNTENWTQTLKYPQIWRLAHHYLQLLGQEITRQMGYSYEGLQSILEAHRPHAMRRMLTFPLAWLLEEPVAQRSMRVRLMRSLQRRGIGGTVPAIVQTAVHRL